MIKNNKPRTIRAKKYNERIDLTFLVRITIVGSKIIITSMIPVFIISDSVASEALNVCIYSQNYLYGTLKKTLDGEIYIEYTYALRDATHYDEVVFLEYINVILQEAEDCYHKTSNMRASFYQNLYGMTIVEEDPEDFEE